MAKRELFLILAGLSEISLVCFRCLYLRLLVTLVGSLLNDDGEDNDDVTPKCKFTLFVTKQLFSVVRNIN